MLCFQGDSLLAYFASLSQERARRDVYTVSCMLCVMFSGRFVACLFCLAESGESKERCIYSKLYAVCHVFRAIRFLLILPH